MPERNSFHSDFLGRNLEVGDVVTVTSSEYASQILYKVISFTPKKVRLGKLSKDATRPGFYLDEFAAKNRSILSENSQICLLQKFDNSAITTPHINF